MQISGSIFAVSNNWFEYAKILKESKVNYLHIDLFEKNEIPFTIEEICKFDETYLPLDVHLIYSKITGAEIDILNASSVHYLNVQYEALCNKEDIRAISKKFRGNFGLAITMETPLEVIDKYKEYLSQILIMCSIPGISGAKFDDRNYDRIAVIRNRYPNLPIFADGGINDKISEEMNKLGVKMVVSGSFLAKSPELLSHNVYSIKYSNEEAIPVTRIMIPSVQLPLVECQTAFIDVISKMNTYRLGIVLVTKGEKLVGIITDGDVRRAYLKYKEDLFMKHAEHILNSSPAVAESDWTVEQVFEMVTHKNYKGIYVVPILHNGSLIGALDLHIDK